MATASEITWLTLLGLSLLFVGGFVLWVYGAQPEREAILTDNLEVKNVRTLHMHLVQWFLLYGAAATFAGVGCLLTATMIIL